MQFTQVKTEARTSLILSLLFCLYTMLCFFCLHWHFTDNGSDPGVESIALIFASCIPFFLICYFLLNRYSFERKKNIVLKEEWVQTAKSEENYKTLINRISDGFLSLDKNLHFTYANEKILELTGKKWEEVINKSIGEVFPEALGSETYSLIKKALENQTYISNVEHYKPLDLWQENHIYPSKDGLSVFIRDISENKKAEASARKSDSRFRALIENSEDIITLMDAEGKIIYVSPAFERVSGYTSKEIVGNSLFSYMPGDNITISNSKLKTLLDNPGTKIYSSNRLLLKNGDFILIEGTVSNLLDDESVSAIVCNFRDVTDTKKKERDLLKNAEEKEAFIKELSRNNEDLQQFSYITSHNLRGPIASLLGLSNLLSNFDIADPTLRQILLGIQKATLRFDETIKDLNTILSAKEQKSLKKETLVLSNTFDKTTVLCEDQIKECEAQITYDFSKAPKVVFNKSYLESIFMNLLTNSLKYRDVNRPLKIHVHSEMLNDSIVVKFKDNGIGMDVGQNANKLFKPYQRFHNYVDGKGLGLFIIKSGLEAFGGSIEIRSELNKGTEFTIMFRL